MERMPDGSRCGTNSAPDAFQGASGTASGMMSPMAIRPFRIEVPQTVLDDLHRRLDATRWVEPIPGSRVGLRGRPELHP